MFNILDRKIDTDIFHMWSIAGSMFYEEKQHPDVQIWNIQIPNFILEHLHVKFQSKIKRLSCLHIGTTLFRFSYTKKKKLCPGLHILNVDTFMFHMGEVYADFHRQNIENSTVR